MKSYNINGTVAARDIVHLSGSPDIYDISENNGSLVYTTKDGSRQYLMSTSIESLRFKHSGTEGKSKYDYVEQINLYTIRKSCLEILENNSSAANGLYMIKPDGINDQQVYCDMSEGWTLVFSYDTSDHNSVDETAFPTIAGSRNKLLSKVWGMTDNLHGNGHTVGNIMPKFKDYITDGSTQLMAEVVRVDNGARLKAERFNIQDKNFIDRVHTNNQADCWTSADGSGRLIIANYDSPAYTYNRVLKAGCTGGPNSHFVSNTNYVSTGNWGIDGALIYSEEGSGSYGQADQDITIHVNWYGTRSSETLYTTTASATQSKFGTSATWGVNTYGRSGATPGPMICVSECGYTNQVQNMFKMRLWIK